MRVRISVLAYLSAAALTVDGCSSAAATFPPPMASQGPSAAAVTAPSPIPSPAGVTFSSANPSCSSPSEFRTTIHLQPSVSEGTWVNIALDGVRFDSAPVSSDEDWVKQADNSWIRSLDLSADNMRSTCQTDGMDGPIPFFTPGSHTIRVTDDKGTVLAQGSYTASR